MKAVFLAFVVLLPWVAVARVETESPPVETAANRVAEWIFTSTKAYKNPFADVELDAVFTAPDGQTVRVPAFWAGGQTWRVRYASPQTGHHSFRTECSDARNPSLHGRSGALEVKAYAGDNLFYRHGPARVAADHKHFEHADGTPFFWLGEGWYMGLCARLKWPEEFQRLTRDRVEKGFDVVQIVAGLYPDMAAFDPRGANEGGFPWTKDFGTINPAYFDAADKRIAWLVDSGIAPCLFGAWGYYAPWMGEARIRKHWRYLVARYAAYPVFWTLAGETTMPYYLSTTREKDRQFQRRTWTEVARYVHRIDGFHRPLTVHPGITPGRAELLDASLLDFEMLQTGHDDLASVPYTVSLVRGSRLAKPPMPTIDGEVCYEGILGHCRDDLQRYLIWRCLLCGTAGHSYGANGIWQINRPGQPYGNSPAGNNWGNTPWEEAMALPGSRQMGVARRFFESHDWWKLNSHPEWVDYASPAPEIAWGHWIWVPGEDATRHAPVGRRYFRRTFNTPGQPVVRAFLRVAADDNVQVSLNGQVVGEQVGWTPYREFEVSRFLLPGTNLISAVVGNVRTATPTNAAGLLCNLSLTFSGGTALEISSDENWRCSQIEMPGWSGAGFDDREWSAAVPVALPGAAPWGKVTSPDTLLMPDAAGLPGKLRVVLLPTDRNFRVDKLEPGVRYAATFLNPQTGELQPLAAVAEGDAKNSWPVPQRPPGSKDWVLLLEAR